MTTFSKTLPPAQEADAITQKLARVAALEFEEWCTRAVKSPPFRKWFKAEYGEEPISVLEKITPAIRAAFMIAWERELRADADVAAILAKATAATLAPADDDDADDDDGEDIPPDLPMTRAESVLKTVPGDDGERETRTDPPDATADLDPIIPPQPDYPYPGEDDPGVILLDEWCRKFRGLNEEQEAEWISTHVARQVYAGPFLQTAYLEPLEGAEIPESLADFAAYNETVRAKFSRAANRLVGRGLETIDDDEGEVYLVPNLIPAEGPTMFYGRRKSGKSSKAHKLSIELTAEGRRVLYVTADTGADMRKVKRRFRSICNRLGVPVPDSATLCILDSPLNLTDPAEVEAFLKCNPGPWALIVIDPLFRCVGGREITTGTGIANDIDNGCRRICDEFGAPLLIIHHETKTTGRPFGTEFIEAAGVGLVHFERLTQKPDVYQDGDRVVMTAEWFKNDSAPPDSITYWIEGAFLATAEERTAAGTAAGDLNASPATAKRADILAKLPTTATGKAAVRKSIEHMLVGKTAKARENEWRRLWNEWADSGQVAVKGDKLRRV